MRLPTARSICAAKRNCIGFRRSDRLNASGTLDCWSQQTGGVIMLARCRWIAFALVLAGIAGLPAVGQQKKEELFLDPIDLKVPHISTDKAIRYDYDIVYVRTPRKGDKASSRWTEIAHPA